MDGSDFGKLTGSLPNVLLFSGEEELLKQRALATLRAKYLPEGFEAMAEADFDGLAAFRDIRDAAETLPFMCERRLVVVRDSQYTAAQKGPGARGSESDTDALAEYLPHVPDTTVLVFYCTGKADTRLKVPKAIAKLGGQVDFPLQSAEKLASICIASVARSGKKLSKAAAERLVEYTGRQMLAVRSAVEKLAAFVGERKEITTGDVEAAITPNTEAAINLLANAVMAGHADEAARLLRTQLEAGETPVGLLAYIAAAFRSRLKFRISRGGTEAARLREALDAINDADYKLKSGVLRPDIALYGAVFRAAMLFSNRE